MGTPSARKRETWQPLPWLTLAVRAAWPDQPSRRDSACHSPGPNPNITLHELRQQTPPAHTRGRPHPTHTREFRVVQHDRWCILVSSKSLATCTDLGLIGSQFSLSIPPHPVVKQPIQPTTAIISPYPSPGVTRGTGLSAQQQTTRPPPPSTLGGSPNPHKEHHHLRCRHLYHSLGRRRTATGLNATCWITMQQVASTSVSTNLCP